MMNDLLIEIQDLCQKHISLIYSKLKLFGFFKLFVFVQFVSGNDTMRTLGVTVEYLVIDGLFLVLVSTCVHTQYMFIYPCAHTDISIDDAFGAWTRLLHKPRQGRHICNRMQAQRSLRRA